MGLMTPPASPCSNNPVSMTSSSSSSSSSHSAPQQPPLLPVVPSAAAAALSQAQSTHSWRPEEASRLADQAWQDALLTPAGLTPTEVTTSTSSQSSQSSTTDTSNLWDFVDATTKSNCICAKYVSSSTSSSSL